TRPDLAILGSRQKSALGLLPGGLLASTARRTSALRNVSSCGLTSRWLGQGGCRHRSPAGAARPGARLVYSAPCAARRRAHSRSRCGSSVAHLNSRSPDHSAHGTCLPPASHSARSWSSHSLLRCSTQACFCGSSCSCCLVVAGRVQGSL